MRLAIDDARPGLRGLALAAALVGGCDEEVPGPPAGGNEACGPAQATVVRAIDGDTVELDSGERVRYLMIDTPESTLGKIDCYGEDAHEFNAGLVEGQVVELRYDDKCRDTYDRLLAYVYTDSGEINRILVRRGYACVYHIPPNGDDRELEFRALEREAQDLHAGLWGACSVATCAH